MKPATILHEGVEHIIYTPHHTSSRQRVIVLGDLNGVVVLKGLESDTIWTTTREWFDKSYDALALVQREEPTAKAVVGLVYETSHHRLPAVVRVIERFATGRSEWLDYETLSGPVRGERGIMNEEFFLYNYAPQKTLEEMTPLDIQPEEPTLKENYPFKAFKTPAATLSALHLVADERTNQVSQNGWTAEFDDRNSPSDWVAALIAILGDYIASARENGGWSAPDLPVNMVKVAAVAVAAIESARRKASR
jgi:hypothetical protein